MSFIMRKRSNPLLTRTVCGQPVFFFVFFPLDTRLFVLTLNQRRPICIRHALCFTLEFNRAIVVAAIRAECTADNNFARWQLNFPSDIPALLSLTKPLDLAIQYRMTFWEIVISLIDHLISANVFWRNHQPITSPLGSLRVFPISDGICK
ncbi:hypothetical protein [Undibacterium aquatile]